MITGKLTAKSQTTNPRPIDNARNIGPGDELAYPIEEGQVILTKVDGSPMHDPFVTFGEWAGEADQRAYADL